MNLTDDSRVEPGVLVNRENGFDAELEIFT
jgi:hypothetical protein